jgi:hypothetical protein
MAVAAMLVLIRSAPFRKRVVFIVILPSSLASSELVSRIEAAMCQCMIAPPSTNGSVAKTAKGQYGDRSRTCRLRLGHCSPGATGGGVLTCQGVQHQLNPLAK